MKNPLYSFGASDLRERMSQLLLKFKYVKKRIPQR
ncbi:unnamed protein product [Brassica oleracea]